MGCRRSLAGKRCGGLGGLQIAEDVATRSRREHRLNVIVLERNESGSLVIHLSSEMYRTKRVLYDANQRRGSWSLSSCRRRTAKSVHGGDVVDRSSLRAVMAREEGLEWISTDKVLTINLFTASCFCHVYN
ncbi:hypothetical protein J1N35_019159 [Gossypium stocksii]|uniref:Uncharacterized protein n=1 Tax=Gossypium stocksii TaxID=47602 RepID=A0A9D3VRM9_9ROSI|nr:hypothetical protein J1N35_019159 [Gossypium stocksii]